jgi:hypothetical protein
MSKSNCPGPKDEDKPRIGLSPEGAGFRRGGDRFVRTAPSMELI